ncbi:MAG: VWA domain-containing protein [Acidobacteriaceae bacterium]|nr:VWA domain-containing protein [Acidobacteriaceae bacterium]
MMRFGWVPLLLVAALALAQNVPDAPSAARPAPQAQPGQGDGLPSAPEPQNNVPPPTRTIRSSPPASAGSEPPNGNAPGGNQPSPEDKDRRDQMFTLVTTVNFVVIPVTVKDRSSGRLVDGLVRQDFSVLENGVEQQLKLFTSDPFPLSAAVLVDVSMPNSTLRKIQDSMSALSGAFSQFDEMAFYTFGSTVEKRLDFQQVNDALSVTLKRIKPKGQPSGAPVVAGPMASGPTINGEPVDPSTPHVYTPPREAHVLNDAIVAAALDLSKRDRTRRKILFVISDGREYGSKSSYNEVLKVLLSDNISLYAVGVDDAAIPIVKDIEKVHLPGQGYGNILPKYARATGGEVFSDFSTNEIQAAYSRLTVEARNQYTLGYTARKTPSNAYRSVEVLVHRPDLVVRAKDGYYPLPISAP